MMRVARSSTCLNCGYDLAGIGADGKCPECGTRASVSRSGDALVTAPVGYLMKLSMGAKLLRLAWIATGVLWVVGIALSLLDASLLALGSVMNVALMAAFTVGTWMVTTSQPQRYRAPMGNTSRIVVRAAMALSLILHAVELADVQRLFPREISVLAGLAALIGHVAMCLYLKALARRIRDDAMLLWAERLIWVPVVIFCGGFGLAMAGGGWVMIVGMAAALIVVAGGYIFVLERLRAGVKRAMDVAARRELAEGEGTATLDETVRSG